jgi:predicted O-linked N-acetylglucosamine transferase (SPINDLY family)
MVTLRGSSLVQQAGATVLTKMGLPELVARTHEEYEEIAVALAADVARIEQLRAGMRARFLASPISDFAGFARALEGMYRKFWSDWCEGRKR